MGRFWNPRYEVAQIFDAFDHYFENDTEGVSVPWYQYDATLSGSDSIYDEGSITVGRRWKEPVSVPCLLVTKDEGDQQMREDAGLYFVDRYRLVLSVRHLRDAGVRVDDPHVLLNDRFIFDGHVYAVDSFKRGGHLSSYEVVIGITGYQVKAEELVNDIDFQEYLPLDMGLGVHPAEFYEDEALLQETGAPFLQEGSDTNTILLEED